MIRQSKQVDPFYSTAAWRRVRAQAMRRDHGLCVWCKRAGRYTIDRAGRCMPVMATMVHHIRPLQQHPDLALEMDNLVSLCDRCHDEAHPEKHGRMEQEPPFAVRMGIKVENVMGGTDGEKRCSAAWRER